MNVQGTILGLIDQALIDLDKLAKASQQIGYFSKNLFLSIDHLKEFKTNFYSSFGTIGQSYSQSNLVPSLNNTTMVMPSYEKFNYWSIEREGYGVSKKYQKKEERCFKKRKLSQLDDEEPEMLKINRVPSLGDFEFVQTIGRGAYAICQLCVYKPLNRMFCAKVLSRQDVYRRKQVDHVFNEKLIMQGNDHPNIVKLLMTFNDQKNLYFIMEYVPGGELFSYIQQIKLSEETARFYAAEILLVIEYLHSRNIVYRDLKPENILLENNGHIKLIDFGFARKVPERGKTFSMCGSPHFIAPEVISGYGYDKKVDWWSYGVVLFELLTGQLPFQDTSTFKLFEKIKKPENIIYPNHLSPEAKDLLMTLLNPDPLTRPDAGLIRQHPWFRSFDWVGLESRTMQPPIIPTINTSPMNFKDLDPPPKESFPLEIPVNINLLLDNF